MNVNTTEHLLGDMERLREHLGIERWLLYGGSWGSTLILAYAQRYPHRVSEIVIAGVTTGRRVETDWLYREVGRLLPEQWERFRDSAGPATGNGTAGGRAASGRAASGRAASGRAASGRAASGRDLPAAYARLMEDLDPGVRERAADAWCAWEDAVLSTEPGEESYAFRGRSPADRLAIVRLCAHYFSHNAWLEDGVLLREAERLAGIPGVLIHGRLDLSCPLDTAWQLARAWPHAELVVIDDSGHRGSDTMTRRIRGALDTFAR